MSKDYFNLDIATVSKDKLQDIYNVFPVEPVMSGAIKPSNMTKRKPVYHYIIVNSSVKHSADTVINDALKHYREEGISEYIAKDDIINMETVSNFNEFKRYWNGMGKTGWWKTNPIGIVAIVTHGSPEAIDIRFGERIWGAAKSQDDKEKKEYQKFIDDDILHINLDMLSELKNKQDIQCLILCACSTGCTYITPNVVSTIVANNKIKNAIAPDAVIEVSAEAENRYDIDYPHSFYVVADDRRSINEPFFGFIRYSDGKGIKTNKKMANSLHELLDFAHGK